MSDDEYAAYEADLIKNAVDDREDRYRELVVRAVHRDRVSKRARRHRLRRERVREAFRQAPVFSNENGHLLSTVTLHLEDLSWLDGLLRKQAEEAFDREVAEAISAREPA